MVIVSLHRDVSHVWALNIVVVVTTVIVMTVTITVIYPAICPPRGRVAVLVRPRDLGRPLPVRRVLATPILFLYRFRPHSVEGSP